MPAGFQDILFAFELVSSDGSNEALLCRHRFVGWARRKRAFAHPTYLPPQHQITKNPWLASRRNCSTRPYSQSR